MASTKKNPIQDTKEAFLSQQKAESYIRDTNRPAYDNPTISNMEAGSTYNPNLAPSLLQQVKEKKRMYMAKVRELDEMENELTDSRIEARLEAIKIHYQYI